jgi:hypothetical protein
MKKYILAIFTIISIVIFINSIWTQPTEVCTEQSSVKTIDSLDYRSATITLSNGNKMDVYQATLKPGDSICAK